MVTSKANAKRILAAALLAAACTFMCAEGCAQGGWSMKYLPVDSVKESLIGSEVRVDFKTSQQEKAPGARNIRAVFYKRDTVVLVVGGRPRRFVERWKIYVDSGVLSDQALQTVDGDGETLIIREMVLRAVEKSSLTVTATVYLSSPDNTVKDREEEVRLEKSGITGIILEL
jgi:hypothetical protein